MCGALRVVGASANNLKNVSCKVEYGTLTVVTGVSGSGKSSLVGPIARSRITKGYEWCCGASALAMQS